jgi:lipoate-protein ligase A
VWDDDVGRAAHWLGRAWRGALIDLGVDGATVHTAAMVRSRWSSLVCFAGLGPGEVLVHGRKVVGLSQRRSRAGARFQCTLARHWDPAGLLGLLALDDGDRARIDDDLAAVAIGLDLPFDLVVDALLAHLPTR